MPKRKVSCASSDLLTVTRSIPIRYEDFNVRNIFLRKRAVLDSDENDDAIKNVMPIDWGPPGRYAGVIDLAEIANKDTRLAMTKKFIDTLYSDLDKTFNVEELARELIRHGYTLRRYVEIKHVLAYSTLNFMSARISSRYCSRASITNFYRPELGKSGRLTR